MTYHYGSTPMASPSRSTIVEEIRVRGSREVVPPSSIREIEDELQITITKGTPVIYGDLKNIPKDPIFLTSKTTFQMDCIVEEIPIPKINRVLGLNITPQDAINKEPALTYINRNGETVEYPSGFIRDVGATINLKILGDLGTKYNLIIKDITNTKWYNWNTKQFQHGYNSMQGVVDLVSKRLIIPTQSSETKYHIFFDNKKCEATDYSHGMPTEKNPWIVYQLMKATTTFKFDDNDDRFIPETTLSKAYNPSAVVNINSPDNQKIDFTISVLPKLRKIKLIDQDLKSLKVENRLFNYIPVGLDRTSILQTDLTASVNSSYSVGTITGTITVHKASLRDFDYIINPRNFFTIT
tara:strand:+ start:6326 stop:7384 length:1059 start_codon:yes stop_codon:yes gene_type:complete